MRAFSNSRPAKVTVVAIAATALLSLATLPPVGTAHAGTVMVPPILGGPVNVKVVSLKESRFQTIHKQQFDFSCGSAALASLLTFHYDHPATEMDVFKAMYDTGDQDRIQRYGFSLLDMKTYLEAQGYVADGFRVELDRLEQAGVPAIVLINTHGYKHFVLIKGMQGDEVVVGDPAFGVRIMDRQDFEEMWNGVAFVIRSNVATGRQNYNLAEDWGVRKKAPFGTALSRQSLSAFTVHLTSVTNSF